MAEKATKMPSSTPSTAAVWAAVELARHALHTACASFVGFAYQCSVSPSSTPSTHSSQSWQKGPRSPGAHCMWSKTHCGLAPSGSHPIVASVPAGASEAF